MIAVYHIPPQAEKVIPTYLSPSSSSQLQDLNLCLCIKISRSRDDTESSKSIIQDPTMYESDNGQNSAPKGSTGSRLRLPNWMRSKQSSGAKIGPQTRESAQPNFKLQRGSGGDHARSPTVALDKPKVSNTSQEKSQTALSSGSSNSDEDSMNSKRLQKLHLTDKGASSGLKRLPEESADGDRRFKQSKSPEMTVAHQDASHFHQELPKKERAQLDHVASGHKAESPPQVDQTSSALFQASGLSPADDAGRPGPRRNDQRTNQQDQSTSPHDRVGGADEDSPEGDTSMVLQPDTRPITAEQLVNEVKGIYSGLVMVEKKCVEIIAERASTGAKLSNDQWQALIALHRTLLHEHHDFFLASQHPTASPALRRLAQKYAMPARMWRNGIHAFLELLRQQLPDSYDHMLAFVYIAYSMMALLKESVPSFRETWIECLGDLARYRMAIEEIDMRDREIWANVARMWYNKAADRSPNVGRIQHHLAVLARPVIVQQLFYYSKSLVSVVPFINARESIMLLFSPFLDEEKAGNTFQKYAVIESSLVTAFGTLFTRGRLVDYIHYAAQFIENLDSSITRTGVKWMTQGPEVASSLVAGLLDYGNEASWLWKAYNDNMAAVKSRRADPEGTDLIKLEHEYAKNREVLREEFWQTVNEDSYEFVNQPAAHREAGPESNFESSEEVAAHVLPLFHQTTSIVAQKIGDKNIVPFMSFILSFLWSLAYIPGGLMYIESYVPWLRVITFLNTLGRSGVSEERVESEAFPQPISGTGRQLPEDFPMRGLIWAQYVFPVAFFRQFVTDEDERMLELPSHGPPRAERCLWLGMRLASLNRYFTYNVSLKQFKPTEYALSLERESANYTFGSKTGLGTAGSVVDQDAEMASSG